MFRVSLSPGSPLCMHVIIVSDDRSKVITRNYSHAHTNKGTRFCCASVVCTYIPTSEYIIIHMFISVFQLTFHCVQHPLVKGGGMVGTPQPSLSGQLPLNATPLQHSEPQTIVHVLNSEYIENIQTLYTSTCTCMHSTFFVSIHVKYMYITVKVILWKKLFVLCLYSSCVVRWSWVSFLSSLPLRLP